MTVPVGAALILTGVWANPANRAKREELDSYACADVIFCRNVFIYFSDDAIRSVVRTFSDRMPPHGYLFLAASESLTRPARNRLR